MVINIMGELADPMKQNTSFITAVANKIANSGLAAPVILLLEAHKPLAFIGSQLLLIIQPTVEVFLPRNTFLPNMINLLDDPAQVEALISSLEDKAVSTTSISEVGR